MANKPSLPNVSRLCNPVDLVNLRSRRLVILTDIFGSQITKSNPKAQNQIKAKTNVCCWLRALSLKLNLLCLLHRETVQVYSWIIGLPAGSPRIRTLIHCILSTRCSNTMEQHLSDLLLTVVCRAVYLATRPSRVFRYLVFFDAWHLIKELRLFFFVLFLWLDSEHRATQEGFGLIGSLLVRTWIWSRHRSACDLRPVPFKWSQCSAPPNVYTVI